MRTSQQNEMLKKLQELISKYGALIKQDNVQETEAVLYFQYLKHKYLMSEKRCCARFCKMTRVGKDVYYELNGNVQVKMKSIKIKTLAQVAWGLHLTYEEAFMLFWYNGVTLLSDTHITQAINKGLLKLDTVDWSKYNEEGSMALFDEMMAEIEEQ